jgi:hypothetical protein
MKKRAYTHGDTDVIAAFETLFEKSNGCWIWRGKGMKQRGGYGSFTMRPAGFISARAHRVSWTLYRGEITSAQHVLHSCDNPKCVNPDHLFLGDQQANMDDKVAKGRQNKGDNHGAHKLSETQARSILVDPRPYLEIAKEHGVTIITVSNIKTGRSWKHLGGGHGRYIRAA